MGIQINPVCIHRWKWGEEIDAYPKGIASSNWCMLNTCYSLVLTALQLGELGQQNTDVTFCPKYLWHRGHCSLNCDACAVYLPWQACAVDPGHAQVHRQSSSHPNVVLPWYKALHALSHGTELEVVILYKTCAGIVVLCTSRSLQGALSELLESPPASATSPFSSPCTFTKQYFESSVLSLFS